MQKIFIVEDDASLRDEVRVLLERNGYEITVVRDFGQIVDEVRAAAPDLVLLDLTLPQTDGQVVCRLLRQESNVPILIMTSRNNDIDELLALNTGADDFVSKPFNPQVFLAHIAAQLRRAGHASTQAVISRAGWIWTRRAALSRIRTRLRIFRATRFCYLPCSCAAQEKLSRALSLLTSSGKPTNSSMTTLLP